MARAEVSLKPGAVVDVLAPPGMSKHDVDARMEALRQQAEQLEAQRQVSKFPITPFLAPYLRHTPTALHISLFAWIHTRIAICG